MKSVKIRLFLLLLFCGTEFVFAETKKETAEARPPAAIIKKLELFEAIKALAAKGIIVIKDEAGLKKMLAEDAVENSALLPQEKKEPQEKPMAKVITFGENGEILEQTGN